MPRLTSGLADVTSGLAAGGAAGLAWGLVLAVAAGDPWTLPGAWAVLLLPLLLGGAAGAYLPSRSLAATSKGRVLGLLVGLGAIWAASFFVVRFVLTTSFDLLDEVAAVFATGILAAALAAVAASRILERRLPSPAGRLAAALPVGAIAAAALLAGEVTSRILGFEIATFALVLLAGAAAPPAVELLFPEAVRRRRLASALALASVVALGASLVATSTSEAARASAWSSIRLVRTLSRSFADLTDVDGDGVSGSLGLSDCDDLDPRVFPGQAEVPGDGVDQDCSGGEPAADAVRALWDRGGARAPAFGQGELVRRRWNVLLVTLDAVRADRTSLHGHERPTTPRLDAFARESIVFENAWSPSNYTALSLYGIMTGRHPSAFLDGERVVATAGLTLAERLRARGYATRAIVDFAVPLPHVYRGFDAVDDSLGVRARKAVRNRSTGSTAEELGTLAVRALDEMSAREEPTFLWLHFSEPHAEYLAHADFPFGDNDRDRYDAEIAAADRALGTVLDALRGAGGLRDTLVCVTSDHGEAFGEHGTFTHGETLYEEEVHVPFVLRLPSDAGGVPARRIATPVDLTDLAPTLLDATGLPPGAPMHGESLLAHALRGAPLRVPEALAEVRLPYARLQALRRGDEKVVFDHQSGVARTFDLATDPEERAPVLGRTPAARAAAEWLDLHLAFPRP